MNFEPRPFSGTYRLAFGVVALGWTAAAFAHLYFFALPWMDNWCYFAPSAAARFPGDLSSPFLGTFGGADHAWGLQWPGVQWINSLVFFALPPSTGLYVLWQIVLWLGAAYALAELVRRASGSPFAALAAFGIVLCDRALFALASWQRMELITLVVLCPLVHAMLRRARGEALSPSARGAEVACAFAASLMHPVAGGFAAATVGIGFFLGGRSPSSAQRPRAAAAAVALGGGVLLAWFLGQRDVWSQFVDHAREASTPFAPFRILIRGLYEMYFPSFSAHVLYGGGMLLAAIVALRPRIWSAEEGEVAPRRALAWLSLAVFAVLHIFRNTCYLVLLLPALLPLWALVLRRAWERQARFGWRTAAVATVVFVMVHGAFWLSRTLKWSETGFANLRAELREFWGQLPSARRIYIPDALWEQPLVQPKKDVEIRMTTIPNNASPERRRAYEAYAYGAARPGDLLILDSMQVNQPLLVPAAEQWEEMRQYPRPLPGRARWGWDFRVYRRRE